MKADDLLRAAMSPAPRPPSALQACGAPQEGGEVWPAAPPARSAA